MSATALFSEPAPRPSPVATAVKALEAATTRGRAAVREMVAGGEAPGAAVAVAIGGKIVWSEAFGQADIEADTAASTDTLFGLGSVTKTLTMAAAVRLAQNGKLDLDAPVERYLPRFGHPSRGITLRRLAVHQSGLSDDFATSYYNSTEHFPTVESVYERLKDATLESEPGTQTAYATGLYTLIARALEIAGGQPFETLLRQQVLEPASMASTKPNDPRYPSPKQARFYVPADGGGFELGPPYDPSHKLAGAGYLATASDVARFGIALLSAGFLDARSRDDMFRAVPLASGEKTEFALGFRVTEDQGRPVLYQPGGGIGISCVLVIYPEQELVIALLTNATGAPVGGKPLAEISDAFVAQAKN